MDKKITGKYLRYKSKILIVNKISNYWYLNEDFRLSWYSRIRNKTASLRWMLITEMIYLGFLFSHQNIPTYSTVILNMDSTTEQMVNQRSGSHPLYMKVGHSYPDSISVWDQDSFVAIISDFLIFTTAKKSEIHLCWNIYKRNVR